MEKINKRIVHNVHVLIISNDHAYIYLGGINPNTLNDLYTS